VTKFWNAVISQYEIKDVYTGKIINEDTISELGKFAIDHFIPRSFVANDEIWNLTPTFSSVNSSKSNYLPGRERDKINLTRQQFIADKIALDNKSIRCLYKEFKRKHLNGTEMKNKLYDSGNSETEYGKILNTIITPIYISASNMGFIDWENRSYERACK